MKISTMIATLLMLITLIHADASESIPMHCEGKLVFSGDLIILSKLKDECLIGEEGDDNLEALHQKVLAVCSINHHCAIDGLAILAIPCSNKVGSECAVIFSRIDSVTK